jgi:Mg-chelatase subunit ChlD
MDWPLRFGEPEFLLLLPALALFWWIGRRSLAGLPPARRRAALTLRIGIALLLILALARLQWRSASDRVAVTFVLDWSDSIPHRPAEFRTAMQQYVREAAETEARLRGEPDLTGLIYFGSDATVEHPPSPAPPSRERQAVLETDGTDIAGALRLALSTFPGGVRRRIVLLTDGNQNRGDALAEAESVRTKGARIDVLPVSYRHEREIMAEKTVVPESIQEGIPFNVTTVVTSTVPAEASLILRRNGLLVDRYDVSLEARRNVLTVPAVVESGPGAPPGKLVTWEAEIQPKRPADDRIAENNTASAFSSLRGPPAVLYVDGNLGLGDGYVPRLQETLLRELRLYARRAGNEMPDVRLHLVAPGTLPTEAELAGYDAIILDNVPAMDLGAERMTRIRTLVNDQGVGLLMIGGERAFGVGNYRNTPVEDALPVEMDLKQKRVMPSGALLLVIDRSGSMSGIKLAQAKAAARAAAGALSPQDRIGLIAFDGAPEVLIPPTLADNPAAIRGRIAALGAGGGTDIVRALAAAHDALAPVRANLRHVILLSDGQADRHRIREVMEAFRRSGITVSAVGIGQEGGQPFMEQIATLGAGEYHQVTDPRRLPRIFVKEALFVKRSILFEETFVPAVTDPLDPFLQDVGTDALPPLHGYVATTAKPAASAPLVSMNENRDPILAHWRYGLGRSAAFTSDAKNAWGADWLGWEEYGAFWGGVVWRLLREPPENLRMAMALEGASGRITVQALDEEGNPVPFLDLVAGISTPEGEGERVPLRQTGFGTYEAEFPVEEAGRYQVSVTTRGEAGAGFRGTAYGGLSVPESAEFERLEPNASLLARLAETGGGRLLAGDPADDRPYRREGLPPAMDFRDLWSLLLLAGTLLFPLDVFTRRVMLDWGAIRRWGARRAAGLLGRDAPPDDRVDRLRAAKRAAVRERPVPSFLESATPDSLEAIDTDAERAAKGDPGGGSPARTASRTPPPPAPSAGRSRSGPETDAPAETSYTARLLEAKKRAVEERKRRRPN